MIPRRIDPIVSLVPPQQSKRAIVQIENGDTEVLPLRRGTSTVAQVSPDGSRCLVIDRSGGEIAVR